MGAFACTTFCTRILLYLVGYEIANRFQTNASLYLGIVGLAQAIPALSLAVVGGHFADRMDRRQLLFATMSLQLVCAVGMLITSTLDAGWLLWLTYLFVFLLGVARGFAEPTIPSLEAMIVPRSAVLHAATCGTFVWHACAVLAPMLAGAIVWMSGTTLAFGASSLFAVASLICLSLIHPKPNQRDFSEESLVESLTAGWRFVMKRQILWTAMALDLFAVLFGGAVAMLPLFAKDILHVGPIGLGVLNAAPMLGAWVTAVVCMRYPPKHRAGHKLLWSVFGFGISMILFAVSTNIYLSCIALFASGVLDGLSVVIRKSILRLYSPDHMRGRVAAVSSIFIGASNELGELESGLAAYYLGLVRSVCLGGLATLSIVAGVGLFGKELREFDLNALPKNIDEEEAVERPVA